MGIKSKTNTTAAWLFPSVAAILAVFLAFILPKIFSDKPELRFSISSPISTKLLGTPVTNHIQEVAISNVGETAAKDVVLICDNGIQGYELHKAAETDNIQEYIDNGKLEIRYKDLPPGATFKVVLRANFPISTYNIKLKHSQGVGKDVFTKQNEFTRWVSGFGIYLLFMIIWGWFSFKNISIESDARFNPKRILSQDKPWHIRKIKWDEYTSTAISAYFSKDYRTYKLENLQENIGYLYLSTDKNIYDFEDVLLEQANIAAVKNFTDASLYAMARANGRDEANKILEIVVRLDSADYSTIRTAISEAWVEKLVKILSWETSLSLNKIASYLAEKPNGILPDHWANYNCTINRFIHNNIDYLVRKDDFFDTAIGADYFDYFSVEIQSLIKNTAYEAKLSKIPKSFWTEAKAQEFLSNYDISWMNEKDAGNIRELAQTTIKLYQDEKKFENLYAGLVRIIREDGCGVNLDEYGDLGEQLKNLEKEIVDTKKRVSEKAEKLEELEAGTKEARARVDRQLEIIGSVLRGDVVVFQGLEYPEDIFGPENIARIREVISRIGAIN